MPNNNPDGYNAFGGPNDHQPAYGDIKKLQDLTRLAATSQPIDVGKPKRAQRKPASQSGRKSAAAAPIPPGQPQVPYEQVLAQFWTALASEPGASPLVQQMAGRVA